MSQFRLTFLGEMHTLEEEARVDALIRNGRFLRSRLRFILMENLEDLDYPYPIQIYRHKGIKLYDGTKKRLRLAQYLRASAIGIDLPSTNKDIYKEDVWNEKGSVNLRRSFALREANMLSFINEYHQLGDCVVIVGDTHLRTIGTESLGPPSPIYEKYKRNHQATFIRSPVGEIS